MSPDLRADLWQLPGATRFLEALQSDVRNRRSLVAVVPRWVSPQEVDVALRERLDRDGFWVGDVPIAALVADENPAIAIARELGIEWAAGAPHTLTGLVVAGDLPPVVELTGVSDVSPSEQRGWLQFAAEWARASKDAADDGDEPGTLCLIVRADAVAGGLPAVDTHLGVHCLWGFPDALEAPLICRLALDGASSELQQRWREQVLPALAGDDVALMEQLWDPVLGPLEKVVASLLEYAASRAWTAPSLRALGLDAAWHEPRPGKHGLPAQPPERLLPVWAAGALSASVERGMELHPAALAVLERDEEVRHRLWRGQVRLMLPVIDALRLRACQEITDEMGDEWPLAYTTPNSRAEIDEVRDNPLNCQLGHLEHLLHRTELSRWRPRWMGVIRCARAARNKLAHCQPVEFSDFQELMTEAQRIGALTAFSL